ncbi:MAG: putative bifunctional diguanylate cyclase/phosphodiesterase, partial [Comamonas sp.]
MPFSFLSNVQDRHQSAVRASVLLVSAWLWTLGWSVAAALLLRGETQTPLFALHVLAGPFAWVAVWVGMRGHWRSAAIGLMLFIGLGTAYVAYDRGVYIVSSLMNIAVLTLFAGWALGWVGTLVVTVLAQALLVMLVLQGTFTWGRLFPMMVTCLFLGAVTVIARRAYERHIHKIETSVKELEEQQQKLRLLNGVVEEAPYSLAVVNLQGYLVYANPAFLRQSGYELSEVLGRSSLEVSLTGMDEATRLAMRTQVEVGEVWHGVLRNSDKANRPLTESITIAPIHDADGTLRYLVEIKQDLSHRVQAEERIVQLQNFDALTQLPNRYALFRRLERLLQQSHVPLSMGYSQIYWHAILLVDLDRFKRFNDARGTVWSDKLLQALALRLRNAVAETAFVARSTADQFAIVVENVGKGRHSSRMQAYALAQHLQKELQAIEVHHIGVERVPISCGIGFTVFPFVEPGLDRDAPEHILRRCSVALNQAKSKGTGMIHSYSEALAEHAQRHMQLEQGLHLALAHRQLRLFLQPQVDRHGRVAGLEALVRWQHPQEGLISPGEFIPVAEESGLIIAIGEWVLQQACELLAHPLVRDAGYSVSVNVSALQLQAPDFVPKITALLRRSKIDSKRLTLEVTESLLVEEVETSIQKMVALQALGVEFAIDDFGTGYSSLSYLTKLPVQEIKMDQSFIRNLEPETPSAALVKALLMVAKSRNLRVVAEGVETG